MADFSATIRTLQQQRHELLEQVAAIDRAIAALSGTDKPYRTAAPVRPATVEPPPRRSPARKRTFVLTEEHKRKLVEGRKKAREARGASVAPVEAMPVIAGWSGDGPPRLVKPEVEN